MQKIKGMSIEVFLQVNVVAFSTLSFAIVINDSSGL